MARDRNHRNRLVEGLTQSAGTRMLIVTIVIVVLAVVAAIVIVMVVLMMNRQKKIKAARGA